MGKNNGTLEATGSNRRRRRRERTPSEGGTPRSTPCRATSSDAEEAYRGDPKPTDEKHPESISDGSIDSDTQSTWPNALTSSKRPKQNLSLPHDNHPHPNMESEAAILTRHAPPLPLSVETIRTLLATRPSPNRWSDYKGPRKPCAAQSARQDVAALTSIHSRKPASSHLKKRD